MGPDLEKIRTIVVNFCQKRPDVSIRMCVKANGAVGKSINSTRLGFEIRAQVSPFLPCVVHGVSSWLVSFDSSR